MACKKKKKKKKNHCTVGQKEKGIAVKSGNAFKAPRPYVCILSGTLHIKFQSWACANTAATT